MNLPFGYPVPVLKEHALIGVLVAVYAIVAAALAARLSEGGAIIPTLYGHGMLVMLGAAAAAYFIVWMLHIVLIQRPTRPLREAVAQFLSFDLIARMLAGLPALLLLCALMSVYSSWKFIIPEVNAFSWDRTFHDWDVWLHGGSMPWQWLQPLLGYPLVTSMVNAVYNGWLFVIYFVFFWQAFTLSNHHVRTQFMLAFFLVWMLLGNVMATALSSAGPCYFGLVVDGGNPYVPLMGYLHAASEHYPIWSLSVQDVLWADYQARELSVGRGISAMPSLHVASSTLVFLVARTYGKWPGWLAGGFLAAIMVGSVHLGWHYAIDGYVALVATWLIWTLSGKVSLWVHRYATADGRSKASTSAVSLWAGIGGRPSPGDER